MVEGASAEKQLENLKEFASAINSDSGKEHLLGLIAEVENNQKDMKEMNISGVKVVETDVFKKEYPEFLKLQQIDNVKLLDSMGGNLPQLIESFSSPNFVSSLIQNASNLNSMEKMAESISYSNNDLNRIIRGVKEYVKIKEEMKSCSDFLKQVLALVLYKYAYETHLRIIKEVYSKIHDIPVGDIDNDKMYNFFDENNPLIREGTSNKLRNDESHLNYDLRDKYSVEQLIKESDTVMTKAITGLIAKFDFIIARFKRDTERVIKAFDWLKENPDSPQRKE